MGIKKLKPIKLVTTLSCTNSSNIHWEEKNIHDEHVKQTGHCANLENFTIMKKATNELDLLIFESLLIFA